MKASDVLGRPVVSAQGNSLGIVHDLRVRLPGPTADDAVPVVVALVVGPPTTRSRLAHAWGFAQGHARGPALLRALVGNGGASRHVATDDVASWDDGGRVRLGGGTS